MRPHGAGDASRAVPSSLHARRCDAFLNRPVQHVKIIPRAQIRSPHARSTRRGGPTAAAARDAGGVRARGGVSVDGGEVRRRSRRCRSTPRATSRARGCALLTNTSPPRWNARAVPRNVVERGYRRIASQRPDRRAPRASRLGTLTTPRAHHEGDEVVEVIGEVGGDRARSSRWRAIAAVLRARA